MSSQKFSVLLFAAMFASLGIILLVQSFAATDNNFYIRDGGTSTACSDWANACDALPPTLLRGATYYIASGSYAGRTFNTPASGTLPISIKGATVADHGTSTGWNNTYSVDTNDGGSQAVWTSGVAFITSYWIFDGSAGPVWSKDHSRYGFKFNVMPYPLEVYNTSSAISNVRFSHISAKAPTNDNEKYFLGTDNLTKSVHNVTLSNSLAEGWDNVVHATSASLAMNDWVVEYNVMLNGYGSAARHGEDINNNYSYLDRIHIRYNLFENRTQGSTAVIVTLNADAGMHYIYGNVFKNIRAGNGVISGSSHATIDAEVYNNVFDNAENDDGNGTTGGWLGSNLGNVKAQNNIIYNTGGNVGGTKDYNAYWNTPNASTETNRYIGTGSPFVDAAANNYKLTANAASIMPAGISLAPSFNTDLLGIIRGQDGKWDRGVYEYSSGSPPTPTLGELDASPPVNGHDLSLLLSKFNTTYAQYDLDNVQPITGHDLSLLLGNWGK